MSQPCHSAPSLNFDGNDVSFGENSTWFIDLVLGPDSTNSDSITGVGDLNIASGASLDFSEIGSFTFTEKFTLATYTGTLTGAFVGYSDNNVYAIGSGSYLFLYDDDGAITLTAVP